MPLKAEEARVFLWRTSTRTFISLHHRGWALPFSRESQTIRWLFWEVVQRRKLCLLPSWLCRKTILFLTLAHALLPLQQTNPATCFCFHKRSLLILLCCQPKQDADFNCQLISISRLHHLLVKFSVKQLQASSCIRITVLSNALLYHDTHKETPLQLHKLLTLVTMVLFLCTPSISSLYF